MVDKTGDNQMITDILYTDAPKDYDGMETETLNEAFAVVKLGKREIVLRKVKTLSRHANWQSCRYMSGMYLAITEEKLNEEVDHGNIELIAKEPDPEYFYPKLNLGQLTHILAALRYCQMVDLSQTEHYGPESAEPLGKEQVDELCELLNCAPNDPNEEADNYDTGEAKYEDV